MREKTPPRLNSWTTLQGGGSTLSFFQALNRNGGTISKMSDLLFGSFSQLFPNARNATSLYNKSIEKNCARLREVKTQKGHDLIVWLYYPTLFQKWG